MKNAVGWHGLSTAIVALNACSAANVTQNDAGTHASQCCLCLVPAKVPVPRACSIASFAEWVIVDRGISMQPTPPFSDVPAHYVAQAPMEGIDHDRTGVYVSGCAGFIDATLRS
eukprot:745676-Pelagomonas_calceolata.AAC.3